jgi:16S rRNA (uracil1498-N3)-methyltransferase
MSEPRHRIFLKASRVHLNEDPAWADIDPDNVHHLRHVLRLGKGARIRIFDGSGREYEAHIYDSKPGRMRARILGSSNKPETESRIRITLAQALIKENNFDRILTSCTELGCACFIPLITTRTVVKIRKADLFGKMRRWDKILERAAAQCGRVKVPEIEAPKRLAEFLEEDRPGLKLILSPEKGDSGPGRILGEADSIKEVILISGPEGGLEEAEERLAIDSGCHAISLGPRTLRAETAGAAAMALLQYLAGDMD